MVGLGQEYFNIINVTSRPQLADQRTISGGAIEVRKIVEELPDGQTRINEQKVIVTRLPNPGEEATPAQIERRYVVNINLRQYRVSIGSARGISHNLAKSTASLEVFPSFLLILAPSPISVQAIFQKTLFVLLLHPQFFRT